MNLKHENEQFLPGDYLKNKNNRKELDVYTFEYNSKTIIGMVFNDPVLDVWRMIGLNVNDSWELDCSNFSELKKLPKGSILEV
jgi:hypothetical protein